jgi:hypothetical protein
MAKTERPKRRTGWTILIVPPNPGRRTRAVHVRTKHVRAALAIGALCSLTVVGLGAMVATDSLEVTATADQLADAHQMILTLTDSLRSVNEQELAAAGGSTVPGAPRVTHAASRSVVRPGNMGLSAPAPGVVLPVIGQITSRFTRSRFHPLLRIFRPHKGVDVSAPAGTNITAPAAGRVAFVGRRLGDGLMVELDHGEGVVSRYAHCKSVSVREGDFVSFGDIIATVGSSGLSTGPHVHFEVLVRGRPVDPLNYLITAKLTPRETPPAPLPAAATVQQAGTPTTPHPPAPAPTPERTPGSDQHPDSLPKEPR